MTISCHKIKMRILENDGLVAAELEHVENCADCREYSQTLNRALDHVDDKEPPAGIDQAILLHARSRARANAPLPTIIYFKLAATAAAALITIFVGIEAYRRWTRPTKSNTIIVDNDRNKVHGGGQNEQVPPGRNETVPEPELVAEFDWDSDSIDDELTAIEAEIFLLTSDDTDADLVSDVL